MCIRDSVRTYHARHRDKSSDSPATPSRTAKHTHSIARVVTSQPKIGTLLHKQHVYASSEMWSRAAGRGVTAAKGGSRQRKYLCDQQNQGCKARALWSTYSSPFINLSPFFVRNFGPERRHACPFLDETFFSGTMLTLVYGFNIHQWPYIYTWASIDLSLIHI